MSVDRQTYGQTLIAMLRSPTGAWRRAPADWVEVVNYLDHCCQHKACGEHEARRYRPISGAWAAAKLLPRLLLRSGAGGRYGSKSGRYPRDRRADGNPIVTQTQHMQHTMRAGSISR